MTAAAVRAAYVRARGGRLRKRSAEPPKLPTGAEMAYVRALRAAVRRMRDEVLARLEPGLKRAQEAERQDATDDLRAILLSMVGDDALVAALAGAETLATIATVWGRVETHNRGQMERVLGVTGPLLDLDLRPELDRFRAENVRLIRSIGPEALSSVLEEVTEAQRTGMRVEELRARIAERFEVSGSRAELIARDQILKANADLSRTRMQRVGVTRYRWSTSRDVRVRADHAALEGTMQTFSDPPVVDQRTGRRANPGVDFQCLPAHEHVRVAHGVRRAFRRPVSGQELVRLVTAEGLRLEVTPNHPVLTGSGWKAAQHVEVGDDVFSVHGEGVFAGDQDVEHGPPTASEVFEACALLGVRERVAASGPQFHGDMADGEVEVVLLDGVLLGEVDPALTQQARELLLADADAPRLGSRESAAVGVALGLPSHGIMGRAREALALLLRRARHADEHRLGPPAQPNPGASEGRRESPALDAVSVGERLQAEALDVEACRLLAREVLRVAGWPVDAGRPADAEQLEADAVLAGANGERDLAAGAALTTKRHRVVDLSRSQYSGHVFNLETGCGWYSADVVVHNCRCVAIPIFDDDD